MEISKLINYDAEYIQNYIKNCNDMNIKKQILKNNDIRNIFLEDKNHYPFIWLVQSLGDDLPLFIDNDFLEKILNNRRASDKLNGIITSDSKFAKDVFSNENVIKYIIDGNDFLLIKEISHCNLNFGRIFFNYAVKSKNTDKLKYLREDVLITILKENENNIYNINIDNNICNFGKGVIEYLITFSYFENIILNYDIHILNVIASKGVILPIKSSIISKYLNIKVINTYRGYIDILKKNNPILASKIETERKEYYDKQYNSLDSNDIIEEYDKILKDSKENRPINTDDDINLFFELKDCLNIEQSLQINSEKRMLEMLIDRYFEDIPYNFYKNLEAIINFTSSISNKIIDNKMEILYKKIYNFYDLSNKEKMSLYADLKGIDNLVEVFYDDYRKCQNTAYKMYNEEIINISKMSKSPLTDKYNCDIYELNGENFKAIVHNTRFNRNESLNKEIWYNRASVSFSMISNKNINLIYDSSKTIILGFSNLDPDRVMHTYHSDSYSSGVYSTPRIREVLSPNELMNKTKGYNEILYMESNPNLEETNTHQINPSYVMCYDDIKIGDLSYAKMHNIPIIILHTDKYNTIDDSIDITGEDYISYDTYKTINRR